MARPKYNINTPFDIGATKTKPPPTTTPPVTPPALTPQQIANRKAREARRAARAAQQPPPGTPPAATPPPGQPPAGTTPGATDPYVGWQNPSQGGDMEAQLWAMLTGGAMGSGIPQEVQGGGYGGPSGIGGGGMDDPMSVYLSTVPVMDAMAQNRISGAMGQAGLGGSRFSSGAQSAAGKIGSETALQQNQMLNELLYNQTQQDLNRGLQASLGALNFGAQDLDRGMQAAQGLGQLGLGQEQAQQGRYNQLGQAGQWEQGRQDQFSMQRYLDFINSRKGWLPELFGLAGQASGSPGQPQGYPTTTSSGQAGLIDMLPLLLGIFGK